MLHWTEAQDAHQQAAESAPSGNDDPEQIFQEIKKFRWKNFRKGE